MSETSETGRRLETAPQPFVYHRVRRDGNGASDAAGSALPQLYETPAATQEEWQEPGKHAWERGFQEGKEQAAHEMEQLLEQARNLEREAVAEALQKFNGDRNMYFRDVEAEVVQLALGVARRILNREAQIDPLVLSGVVRVALEKVAARTGLRLRVHPIRLDAWQEFFTRQPDLEAVPALVPDASLEQDACVLETSIGTTELSLGNQLKEIEQGFADLLDRRPRGSE